MANPSVSLTNYDQQLAEIKRRQALAQMLQEQANAPIDIQSYKGIQAPIPWTAVLAKALQGGVAAHQARKAEKQQGEMTQQARQQAVEFLRNMTSQVPNVQASQPMRTEQVQAPMSAPGLQTPQQLMAGGVQGMTQRMAAPPQAPIAAPPPAAPQSISVPDMTPQPAMLDRRATDRQQMALEGMVSANPLVQPLAGQMYEQATKDVSKEKMADAISKVDIGDADPNIIKMYLSSDTPEGAIKYLSDLGMEKVKAQATIAEIKLRAQETAEQREADRDLRRDLADQSSADRLAIAQQSSADRRFTAGLAANSSAENRALREQMFNSAKSKMPARIASGYAANNAVINQIDDAIAAIKARPGSLGLQNVIGDTAMQRLDPKGVGVRAKVADITAVKRHDLSGAAVTAIETPYLKPLLPNQTDRDEPAITKLLSLRENFLNTNREMESAFGSPADFGSPAAPAPAGDGWGKAVKR